MAKILYSANTNAGKPTTGFIIAESNEIALQLLTDKGYSEVRFHNDSNFQDRKVHADLDKMDPQEIKNLSKTLIRNQTLSTCSRSFSQLIKLFLVALPSGILLILLGYFFNSMTMVVIGLAVIPILLLSLRKNFNAVNLGNLHGKMAELLAHGQLQQAEKLVDRILANKLSEKFKTIETEMIGKKAYLLSRRQSVGKGLAYLDAMQDKLKDVPEWRRNYIYGNVYMAIGDFQKYLEYLRDAHEKAPDNQTVTLDLAASEARWGDLETAKQLMASVNTAALAQYALPYVDYANGLIARKSNDTSAVEYLGKAYEKQMDFKNNVHMWQVLAIIAAYYGLALRDAGKAEQAEKIVLQHWDVLKNFTDRNLLQELKTRMPALNSQ